MTSDDWRRDLRVATCGGCGIGEHCPERMACDPIEARDRIAAHFQHLTEKVDALTEAVVRGVNAGRVTAEMKRIAAHAEEVLNG